jgi:hypothetical protein
MQHVVTVSDILKVTGIALAIIIPIGLVLWFLSTIDFSK